MSEQKPASLYQQQKTVKPLIEDIAGDFIDGDKLRNLLDFLSFLKGHKLTPRWQSGNSWKVSYKGKGVCFIKIVGASWFVMLSALTREKCFVGYDGYFSDELKEFVWENIKSGWCPNNCKGRSRIVFGKEFNDFCTCWAIRIENPDGVAVELSKRLILAIKGFISDLPAVSKV